MTPYFTEWEAEAERLRHPQRNQALGLLQRSTCSVLLMHLTFPAPFSLPFSLL